MKSFLNRNPVTMAAIALACTAGTGAVAFNISRLPVVGAGPIYSAVFSDASGLLPNEEVRVAGLKVGQVTSIKLEGDHVLVRFHVKGLSLGQSTTASIEIKTMLGQHFLALTPAGSGRLSPGSVIPLQRTTVPLNIVPALQTLTKIGEQTDTASLARAFDTLAQSLDLAAPEVHGTLAGLSRLSATIASRDEQLAALLHHARSVTATIADERTSISQIVTASNEVLTVLSARREAISEIIAGTRTLATQLRGLVADNRGSLGPALAHLAQVQAVLDKDRAQIDETLSRLPGFYRLMSNVVGSGAFFDATVKLPAGLSLCDSGSSPLSSLVDPVLSTLNNSATGGSAPCLPLGAAASQKGTR